MAARHRGPGRKPIERHGESTWADNTPEYQAWTRMVARCENENDDAYAHYGARGIKVCSRWRLSYRDFLSDLGRRPSRGHSIDRIDVDGNYEPGNVRWATLAEAMRNMRSNRHVTIHGERMTLAEAIERFAIVSEKAVHARLGMGWAEERAILAPMQPQGRTASPEMRARIVEARRAGASLVSIAADVGMCTRTVGVIARNGLACTGEQ